jgi:hypothetical protein
MVLFKKRAGKKSLYIIDQHLIISHYDNYSYYESCFVYLKLGKISNFAGSHKLSRPLMFKKSLRMGLVQFARLRWGRGRTLLLGLE